MRARGSFIFASLAVAAALGVMVVACGPPPVCAAIPVCEADEEQVDACETGDNDCREVTVCDSTIHCKKTAGDAGM